MSELIFDGTPLHTLLTQDTTPMTAAPALADSAPTAPAPAVPASIRVTPAGSPPRAPAVLLSEQIQQAHAAVLAAHHAIARHQVRLAQVRLAEESVGTGRAR
ncbi:hypothetical protein ABZ858_36030 [Streptomyces sp. NPDC047017]|uniref:hypothetical protein n=1 Tax=Streptomyces sp. NPDC047017 TaxID=3155024 RepID=UPI0033CDBBD3